jgi:TolA-binding protein
VISALARPTPPRASAGGPAAALAPLLVATALLAAGCPPRGPERPASPAAARRSERLFERGQEAYLREDYATAAAHMGAYANDRPQTGRGLQARYWQAMSLLELGHARRARFLLTEVRAAPRAPRDLQALALRGIAQSHAAEEEYAAAEAAYLRLRRLYADVSAADEILAALAELRRKQGDAAGAARYRAQLARSAPESPYAGGAGATADGRSGAAQTPGFMVQAGVFRSRAYADRQVRRLQDGGFEAIVVRHADGYAVQAGRFSTRERAARHAAALKRAGFPAIVKP